MVWGRVIIALACLAISAGHGLAQTHTPNTSPPAQDQSRKLLHGTAEPRNLVVDSDGKAHDLVALILKQYGLKLIDDDWQIWITNDGEETPNAQADFAGGKRRIYFNAAFMRSLSGGGTNWPLLATAAHELGHQLGNHVLRPNLRRQRAEREADYSSGFVLGRMGATFEQASDVIRWLPNASAGSDYPSRAQRLCEIGRGWRDGTRLEPVPSDTTANSALTCEDLAPAKSYRTRINRDIYGNDLEQYPRGLPGIDVAACASKCSELAACKAFSFDRWHGWCFLKSAATKTVSDPTSVIGIKGLGPIPPDDTTVPQQLKVLPGKLFRDKPAEPARIVDSTDQCKTYCASKSYCVDFSYIKISRQCLVFSNSIGYYNDETADSGFKRQTRQ